MEHNAGNEDRFILGHGQGRAELRKTRFPTWQLQESEEQERDLRLGSSAKLPVVPADPPASGHRSGADTEMQQSRKGKF